MQEKQLRNIVFDLGGVLVGLSAKRCIDAFRSIGCGDVALYVEEHRVEDLFLEQELGHITTPQFCDEVRRICGCSASDAEIEWAWNELLTPVSPEKLQLLRELSGRYNLFILSNTNDIHWRKSALDFLGCSDLRCKELFREVFLSYEIQLAKPSQEIFLYVAEKGGIEPAETLFIDDSMKNCEAAGAVGFRYMHETSGQDWIQMAREKLLK